MSIITEAAAAPKMSLIDEITSCSNLWDAKYVCPRLSPYKNVGNMITIP